MDNILKKLLCAGFAKLKTKYPNANNIRNDIFAFLFPNVKRNIETRVVIPLISTPMSAVEKNGNIGDVHLECQLRYFQAQTPCDVRSLITKAHIQYPYLKTFADSNDDKFKLKATDKGFAGKCIEFLLFGRLPNNSCQPDLETLGDLKVTHVKSYKTTGYNAKERLTITNCGNTNDYSTFQHFLDAVSLEKNYLYKKLQKGVIVVLRHNGGKWTSQEQFMMTEVVTIFQYDIETIPEHMRTTIANDYMKIQQCVKARAVTQSGQTFLHIHPHGSKGSKTRALGFTNKFLTSLIAYYTNKPIVMKGRSLFIHND